MEGESACTLTTEDFMLDIYSNLLKQEKWTMNDIDDMDIFYYIDVLAYTSKNNKEEKEKEIYIDQCGWL